MEDITKCESMTVFEAAVLNARRATTLGGAKKWLQMVAYMEVGWEKIVPKEGEKPKGVEAFCMKAPFLDRRADPIKGKA